MYELLLACMAMALLLVVAVLARQVRVRRALEILLRRLLERWRRYEANISDSDTGDRADRRDRL